MSPCSSFTIIVSDCDFDYIRIIMKVTCFYPPSVLIQCCTRYCVSTFIITMCVSVCNSDTMYKIILLQVYTPPWRRITIACMCAWISIKVWICVPIDSSGGLSTKRCCLLKSWFTQSNVATWHDNKRSMMLMMNNYEYTWAYIYFLSANVWDTHVTYYNILHALNLGKTTDMRCMLVFHTSVELVIHTLNTLDSIK